MGEAASLPKIRAARDLALILERGGLSYLLLRALLTPEVFEAKAASLSKHDILIA